jgi:paraquat-inducible protein B
VIARRFDPTSDRLQLTAYISPQFIHYLTPTTIFYRNSGVKVKVGLEGVEVKTAPLAAVVEGAISMEGNWTSTPSPATSYRLWSYDQFKNRNRFQVQLRMKTNPGLRTGTPLYLAGVKIGEVTKLEYDPQTEVVVASISVPKKYRKFFGRGAKIYLDQFQASIDGIRNVGAILTGGILHLFPSQTPPLKKYYRLTLINPPPTFTKPGIRVKLWTPGQRPISVGAPIYYKYVEVGKVEQVELNPDGGVVVTLFFPKKYHYLVRKGDKFSYLYPFKLTTHFLSLKLEVGTLPVILKGGIVLRDVNFSAPLAPAGTLFRLTPLPTD